MFHPNRYSLQICYPTTISLRSATRLDKMNNNKCIQEYLGVHEQWIICANKYKSMLKMIHMIFQRSV